MKRCLLAALLFTSSLADTPRTADGFALPQKGKPFLFPRDHGSHPEFRTEWWYVTGHLDGPAGERFGFQLTFFRQAQRLAEGVAQLHLAHAALGSAAGQLFLHEEKLQRAGWAANASTEKMHVFQDNWSLSMESEKLIRLAFTVRGDAAVELALQVQQPLVIFGKEGVSQKGATPDAASHYLTFPRLAASGTVNQLGKKLSVTGTAWLDHEFSSSQLAPDQAGWDWAALQLQDGRNVMAYRMRKTGGSTDPASSLTLIDSGSKTQSYSASEFHWEATDQWTSPHTQIRYPTSVTIQRGTETFR